MYVNRVDKLVQFLFDRTLFFCGNRGLKIYQNLLFLVLFNAISIKKEIRFSGITHAHTQNCLMLQLGIVHEIIPFKVFGMECDMECFDFLLNVHSHRNAVKLRKSSHCHATPVSSR